MIEAITRDGYVIAQEYLKAAVEGDTLLFVFNGKPLVVDGHTSLFASSAKKATHEAT